MAERIDTMCFRRQRTNFLPVATIDTSDDFTMSTLFFDTNFKMKFGDRLWILLAITILFMSNILYLISFLTTGWGTVHIYNVTDDGSKRDDRWHFGLWLCCRESDNLCVGPRWPAYYSATRALAVLALFGKVLSLAWLIGYAVERLLDYDPCTLWSLISLTYTSAFLVFLEVIIFGTNYVNDMTEVEFSLYKSKAELSYSYWMTCATLPLMVIAGIMQAIEIKVSFNRSEPSHSDTSHIHKPVGNHTISLKKPDFQSNVSLVNFKNEFENSLPHSEVFNSSHMDIDHRLLSQESGIRMTIIRAPLARADDM